MKFIDVFNRTQAQIHAGNLLTVMISIAGPNRQADFKGQWHDILRVEFDDIMSKGESTIEFALFNERHAAQIIDFVEKNIEFNFAVHCDAGFSRSIAVGVWIRNFLESKEIPCSMHTHAIGHTEFANGFVLSTLNHVHNKRNISKL